MKELLYKKSEAVAALNRVDGFHPMELARKIGEEGQEEQLYLDVKYRKLWFRLVNPAGKIISRIITFTENMAVVEARIYLDKCDQEDNYVANSFSQKFRSDDPKFGDKFLEMAETAAVGRALSDAGYGVQFADVGEENDPAQGRCRNSISESTDAGFRCHGKCSHAGFGCHAKCPYANLWRDARSAGICRPADDESVLSAGTGGGKHHLPWQWTNAWLRFRSGCLYAAKDRTDAAGSITESGYVPSGRRTDETHEL